MKKVLLVLIPSLISATIIYLLVMNIFLKKNERGALQVTSTPLSKVYLNNKLIGNTPLCKCEAENMVPTGEYVIKVVPSSAGFPEFQEKITIEKSVLTVVDRTFSKDASSEGSVMTLQPAKKKNERGLLVLSVPDQAEVVLDGNSSGFTPLNIKDITDSDHVLVLKKSGYSEKKIRIHTPSGYKLIATVYLGVDNPDTESKKDETPTPIASPSGTIAQNKKEVTILQTPVGFLRVRRDPLISSDEIGRVMPGEKYEVIEVKDEWYQIKLKNGEVGWISNQYARLGSN